MVSVERYSDVAGLVHMWRNTSMNTRTMGGGGGVQGVVSVER